mgnify:CR=1 FL=1
MTNLSDLFPAGAGKQVSFTASGNVTGAGKPVVLNSDGTVSEVSGLGATAPTETAYISPAEYYVGIGPLAYDTNEQKIVFLQPGYVGYLQLILNYCASILCLLIKGI